MADEMNSLALIPGDRIGNAARALPDATTAADDTREVTIDVPGRFRATITFRRFRDKRRGRWFWTAESAVKIR